MFEQENNKMITKKTVSYALTMYNMMREDGITMDDVCYAYLEHTSKNVDALQVVTIIKYLQELESVNDKACKRWPGLGYPKKDFYSWFYSRRVQADYTAFSARLDASERAAAEREHQERIARGELSGYETDEELAQIAMGAASMTLQEMLASEPGAGADMVDCMTNQALRGDVVAPVADVVPVAVPF